MVNRYLKKYAPIYLVGASACNSFAMWLVAYLITTQQSLSDFGTFSLCIAISTPIYVLARQDLKSIVCTDIGMEYSIGQYAACRFIQSLLAVVLCVFAFYIYEKTFETYIKPEFMYSVVLYKFFESISDVYHGDYIRKGMPSKVATSLLIRFIALLGCISISLFLGPSILPYTLGIASLISLVSYDIRISRSPYKITYKIVSQIVKLSRYAGYTMFGLSLVGNLPRYITDIFLGSEAVATLSWILFFLTPPNILMSTVSSIYLPKIIKLYRNLKKEQVYIIYVKCVMMAFIFGLSSYVMLYIFVRSNIASINIEISSLIDNIILALLLGVSTVQFAGGLVMGGMRMHKLLLIPLITSSFMFLLFCAVLIPIFHLKGILLSILLGAFYRVVHTDSLLRRHLNK